MELYKKLEDSANMDIFIMHEQNRYLPPVNEEEYMCILRSPAGFGAFQSGRCAEHMPLLLEFAQNRAGIKLVTKRSKKASVT